MGKQPVSGPWEVVQKGATPNAYGSPPSNVIPEVFAPPPEIVSGYMAEEAERALVEWNPLIAGIIAKRRLFGAAPLVITPPMQHGPIRHSVLRNLGVKIPASQSL